MVTNFILLGKINNSTDFNSIQAAQHIAELQRL